MSTLPKVYIYCASTWGNPVHDYVMVAVSEDGVGLGSHVCSSPSWARNDLHDLPHRHDAYVKKFGGWGAGEFYDLVEVPPGQAPPDEVMAAIRQRNAEISAGDSIEETGNG